MSSDSYLSAFEVAEKFNEFFVNVGKNIKQSITAESIIYPRDIEMSFRLSSVSGFEIKGIIETLPEKSSGEAEINYIIVKAAGYVITRYLASIINQHFNEGCFTTELKKAKVIPTLKDYFSTLHFENYYFSWVHRSSHEFRFLNI